ncbi:MAG: orange carotenoid protein [Oscillatoriales cyanobacterium]|nr:MAG: orange carotenoid protein [Oscillatoriales cyanobacterium]
MNSPAATNTHALSDDTQNMVDKINGLGTDEKLALLYFIYEKMGDSITPAAPTAAEPELAPMLLNDFYNLSHDQQLNIIAYGALTANNQLLVWYAWAIDMGDKIVDIPEGYEATEAVNCVLDQIEGLEFEQQISVLRDVANNMGYTDVKPIATQAQVGKTSSL